MIFLISMLLTFAIMEGVTWLTHKYVMHGFLWYLHEDHHQPTGHFFEKNDAFFLIFAIPSMACIFYGTFNAMPWLSGIGTGVAMYGFAYFIVHEVIIHQESNGLQNLIIDISKPFVGHTKCTTNTWAKKIVRVLVC